MFSYNLPWMIGPAPIIATVWSAFFCARAILLRTGINGGGFVFAILLPVGIIAFLTQQYFYTFNWFYLLIANQLLAALSCFILLKLANYLRKDGFKLPKKNLEVADYMKMIATFGGVVVFIDILFLLIPVREKCGIAKCFVVEAAIGSKDEIFSTIYFGSLICSLFLLVAFVAFFEIMRKLHQILPKR